MNSPYPELAALSDEERKEQIKESLRSLSDNLWSLGIWNDENKLSGGICLLPDIQMEIDRIKALVMSRGKDE